MTEEIKSRIEQIRAGRVPEGYKQVHSGMIPADWNEATISNIADEITDMAGEGEYETLSISAGIGFVNQAQKFGREKSGAQYAKYAVLHRGDFSYNKGNSNLYPQGCIYRLNDRKEAAVPNVFESFRFTAQDGDYYEQLFVNGFLNKQLYSKINHGVRDDGLLNLTGSDFYSCCLPVPPLPEQKKIAEILRQCDKVIELKQSKIKELQKLKKTSLSKMFPKEGHNVPELRFPGFTDDWEQRKCGEMTEELTEYATFESRYPLLTSSRSGLMFQDEFRDKASTESKETLFSVVPYGKCTYRHMSDDDIFHFNINTITENGLVSREYPVFDASKDSNLSFIVQFLNSSPEFTRFCSQRKLGGTRTRLYYKNLCDFKFYAPSKEEQDKIAAFFNQLDTTIALHQRELEVTQKYKKALMQLLLMGIVREK